MPRLSARLLDRLSAIKNPIIQRCAVAALFAGVELHRQHTASAGTVISRLLQAGVLTKDMPLPEHDTLCAALIIDGGHRWIGP